MNPRAPAYALICALCSMLLVGCGGGNAAEREPAPATASPRSGAGDPAAIKVIRLWSDALRRSDVERASSFWAVPSKVQNGTPVLTLATAADVRVFNGSLSCGSRLTSALGARRGFTIAVFELTRRPGADCGTGTGQRARTAIRVRDGKIAEWYRLPDDHPAPLPAPESPQPEAQPPAGPIV